MFPMNEEFFAEIQKENCWFTLPIFEPVPDVVPVEDIINTPIWQDDACVQRHIFAMTFGGFGYSVDLSKAKVTATIKLGQIEKREPKDKSFDNPEFVRWIGLFAQYNILLGTIFAYQHEYLLAAALLMNGLKTRAVNLFLPYCDFIKYVLSKVAEMPAEPATYEGCGFSVDEPMGGLELNNGTLDASAAEMIIPALEGDNSEIILAYNGGQRYGSLKRLGSTNSKHFRHCIDIYEVLMIDRNFKLKKLRLYFNGYFSRENRNTIRLPNGFRMDIFNPAKQYYNVLT